MNPQQPKRLLIPNTNNNNTNNNKKRPIDGLKLERIIGCTTQSFHSLKLLSSATPNIFGNPITDDKDTIAYVAGTMVVLYHLRKNKQIGFLDHPLSNKPFSCLSFSKDGQYLAAGERGNNPAIVVWDLLNNGKMCYELKTKDNKGHQSEIKCICFSKDTRFLMSIGKENELRIWELLSSGKGELKFTKSIDETNDLLFATHEDNCFFTLGKGFVKIWHYSVTPKTNLVSLKSHSACDLDIWSQSNFVCASQHLGELYAITSEGILCKINLKSRSLQSWVNTKVKQAYSVSTSDKYVSVSCSNGVVRLFELKSLQHKRTLPEPPPATSHVTIRDVMNVNKSYDPSVIKSKDYKLPPPNAIGCCLYQDSSKVAVIYDDRSLFIWDITDLSSIAKYRSFISHSGCIWGLDVLPTSKTSPLPPGTFVTCSSDNTIKFWNIDHNEEPVNVRSSIAGQGAFCKDLYHVLYIPPESLEEGGIRSVKFSPDGCNIITGDKHGYVRVHDVFDFRQSFTEYAHESEVLCLDSYQSPSGDIYFGSGSRDRMIHIYRMNKDNSVDVLHTLDDHSSSVISLKFSSTHKEGEGAKLISIGADKSMVFRRIEEVNFGTNKQSSIRVVRYQQSPAPFSVFDMDVDVTGKWAVTAGQGKRLNIYDVETGKCKFFIETLDPGVIKTGVNNADPLKIQFCPSGIIAVTSASDKHLRVYSFYKKSLISRVKGHSDVITSIRFTPDFKRVISTSADGCIFIWKIGEKIAQPMRERMEEINNPKRPIIKENIPPVVPNIVTKPIEQIKNSNQEENSNSGNSPIYYGHPPSPPTSARALPTKDKVQSFSKQLDLEGALSKPKSPPHPALRDTFLPAWVQEKKGIVTPRTNEENTGNKTPEVGPLPISKWADRMDTMSSLKLTHLSDEDKSLTSSKKSTPVTIDEDDIPNVDQEIENTQNEDLHFEELSEDEVSDVEENDKIVFCNENATETSTEQCTFQVAEQSKEKEKEESNTIEEEKNELTVPTIETPILQQSLATELMEVDDLEISDDEAAEDETELEEEKENSKQISKQFEDDLSKPMTPSFIRKSITSSFIKNKSNAPQEEIIEKEANKDNSVIRESAPRYSMNTVCSTLLSNMDPSTPTKEPPLPPKTNSLELIEEMKRRIQQSHKTPLEILSSLSKKEVDKKLNDFKEVIERREKEHKHVDDEIKETDKDKEESEDITSNNTVTTTPSNTLTQPQEDQQKLPTTTNSTTEMEEIPTISIEKEKINEKLSPFAKKGDDEVVYESLNLGLDESTISNRLSIITTPEKQPKNVVVERIKENVEKLSSLFDETMKELDKLPKEDIETDNREVVDSIQKLVDKMNVRMSQSLTITSPSTNNTKLHNETSSSINPKVISLTSTHSLDNTLSFDVTDLLEKYSNVLLDNIMKKINK